MKKTNPKPFKLALLFGGPSLERGISLNSARSVCDHLSSDEIEVLPLYFDEKKKPYQISRAQLYSNTPSDFDFKLHSTAKPLSKTALEKFLKSTDLAFIAMHGPFGEDGEIQRLLMRLKIPFTGSPESACKKAFDKYEANQFLHENGFFTLPSALLKAHVPKDHKKILTDFFKDKKLKRAIVKPATGGSSIGVYSVSNVEEALEKAHTIFKKRIDTRVVVEPFCEGQEFTAIVLQNRFGLPVAILPTEMELDYKDHQIFDYRKKYLSTNQVHYHCPPRFPDEVIEQIQIQAEQIFTLFGMQDFARLDGWYTGDGQLWFSDLNPISGMEQNSFLFMQSARVGMSHGDVLRYILKSACRRQGIKAPQLKKIDSKRKKRVVNVLFGGKTAERQVSVMSGTNVWLKLRGSSKYNPEPYLLDTKHNVWKLPYALTLNHTVEEIEENCKTAQKDEKRVRPLIERVKQKLAIDPHELSEPWFAPEKMSLQEFIDESEYVFIGLHGGIGENGTIQHMLEKAKVPYNGSDSAGSKVGIDKYLTGQLIAPLKAEGIHSAEKKCESVSHFKSFSPLDYQQYWKTLIQSLGGQKSLIVKPVGDGCSAGVARLFKASDLETYLSYALKKLDHIPPKSLTDQHGIIEMPPDGIKTLMFEQFVVTDKVRIVSDNIHWKKTTDWIEITIGLLGKKGQMKAMNPSITVAHGDVLSLEEKFQGGTGVNITPPPAPYVKPNAIKKAMQRMEKVANVLGVGGYCRIDAFMHTQTGELIIIEANTTPGLTPSTVIYHQALAEKPSMYPREFLERIVGLS